MGIKAGLRKNTSEIRQRIKDMGISCTNSGWSHLVYTESANCVTWGSASSADIDCGENEDFFFYLLSLTTIDESSLKSSMISAQRDYNHLKTQYDDMCNMYYSISAKYDSVVCGIKESLDSVKSENDLLKEIQQLQEKIDKLEKENKSLKKKCNE